MGLDLWFREDIENALRAAEVASAATVAVLGETGSPEVVRAYRQGYRAALAVVAQAFGIKIKLGGQQMSGHSVFDKYLAEKLPGYPG